MDGMAALPPKGADAAHPAGQYGAIAKLFHWVTLGLMLVALPLGFVIQHVKDASKMGFYALHESAGLTILFVALARLAWRRLSPPPSLPHDMPKLMRTTSTAVHHALYALLILQPLLGFLATNAWGFPMQGATAYLGFIELPKFDLLNTFQSMMFYPPSEIPHPIMTPGVVYMKWTAVLPDELTDTGDLGENVFVSMVDCG